jgi:hypothetical protein
MASAPVTPAPIHVSWWAKATTWVKNEAIVVKNAVIKIAGLTPEITAELQKIAPTAEAISNMILPGSGAFEAHLVDVWSAVASNIDAAGAAATANGVNVTLDQALVDQIKAFIPAVKAKMSSQAGAAPAA